MTRLIAIYTGTIALLVIGWPAWCAPASSSSGASSTPSQMDQWVRIPSVAAAQAGPVDFLQGKHLNLKGETQVVSDNHLQSLLSLSKKDRSVQRRLSLTFRPSS